MVISVSVVFEIRLVVLGVVRHEIGEREAVVRSHEVDARMRKATAAAVQIARSGQAARELTDQSAVAFPIRANDVAIAVVPLRPSWRKMSELIAALAQVPRLRDQLHLREQRILPQQLEEWTDVVGLMHLATERRRKIEAEAVDVHFRDP